MLKNYFKVAWRNLLKNKIFSLINLTGLAIGLSCFLLIALYVMDELSYDRFYPNAENIYRLNSDLLFGGAELHITETSDMIGQTLKKDYPEVLEYTRIYNNTGSKLIRKGNTYIEERNVANADSTFFTVFQLPVVEGDAKTALNEPNTVVISESVAKKYFETTHAVGKTIETNDEKHTTYKVTAVIKDIPHNSHLNFDFLFSMKNVDYPFGQHLSFNFHTYLLMRPGTTAKNFGPKLNQYIAKYVLPQAREFMNISSMEDFKKAGNKLEFSMIPLTKIHLYSDFNFEITPPGNIQYVYIFSAVALFILLIACINFMNLTTAKSTNRAREVGIRKVLGTQRKSLIAQFLFESVLLVACSLLLALVAVYLVLPVFNNIADKSLALKNLFSPLFILALLALPLVVGLIAGSYPAFYLSGFRPIEVLKGKLTAGKSKAGLRSFLVVFQFAISILLIIGTIVIYKQLNYIQTRNLGFNKDQVLIIDNAYELKKSADAFKNNMLQQPGVTSATLSGYLPVSNSSRSDQTFSKEAVMDAKNGLDMQTWSIDYDYFKTLGMRIVAGRNFSREFGTDSNAVIINETAAKNLGYSEPIGKKIYSIGGAFGPAVTYTIIGVVKNFNFESLRKNIGSVSFFLHASTGLASFKVNAANLSGILKAAETNWKQMAPGMPFSYRFLDDSFTDMYRVETRVGQIALIFSVLAIFIACLGLFGLATFIAEQRTKEIGIRKVLGASTQGIVRMLSKDFVKLVAISFIISAPLAWLLMHKWLQDFAYRVDLSWWIFFLALAISLFIAIATISVQAIRAAIANPAKSLRTE
ncbi:MAG: ABC transporter permease [Ginsengibacter sp.]